jgi:4-hydroxy-3-methylbut-2-enyl diphosphate reductase
MKVILAKSAGFCMGVRRAVETTLDLIQKEDTGVSKGV